MAPVLVVVLLCSIPQLSLAQSEVPDSVFWDGFETGDLLHWEGVDIPGGGSIEFPPGSLAPGTQVSVTPIATPTLPDGIEALGQSYEIVFIPDLLDPVILTLPLPLGEGPADVWIVDVAADDSVTVFDTEVLAGQQRGASTDDQGLGNLIGQTKVFQTARAIQAARFDSQSAAPRITDSGFVVVQLRIGLPFLASVDWEGEATEIDFEWSLSGPTDTVGVTSGMSDTSIFHTYLAEPGRKRVSIEARGASPNMRSVAYHTIYVTAGIPGFWTSTSGEIYFDPATSGGAIQGTYNPTQNGVIRGGITGDGHLLTGNWVETLSTANCETEMPDSEGMPSIHWGTLEFTFDEDFTVFCGRWGHCDNDFSTSFWRGYAPGFAYPDCPLP